MRIPPVYYANNVSINFTVCTASRPKPSAPLSCANSSVINGSTVTNIGVNAINEYYDEETLAKQGVKLISFEYPTPVENSLIFSHISYFSGAVVLPTLLIALLALLATIIFVRKEKELKYKTIDIVSIVLGFVIGLTLIPFVSILAFFIDIEGGGPELYYQILYFIPAVSVLPGHILPGHRDNGCGKDIQRVYPKDLEYPPTKIFCGFFLLCGDLGWELRKSGCGCRDAGGSQTVPLPQQLPRCRPCK